MAKVYNIFISHSWTHADAYDRLVDLLNARGSFPFDSHCVLKDDPVHHSPDATALYQAIYRQMIPCHIVLIMAGVYVTYKKWIDNEIQIAKHAFISGKPILGIRPWGNTNVSTAVAQNADKIVNWNTESVVRAVRRLVL